MISSENCLRILGLSFTSFLLHFAVNFRSTSGRLVI